MKNIIRTRIYESPCGSLLLGSYGDMLCLCDWLAEKHHGSVRRRLESLLRAGFVEEVSPVTEEAARQLDEYFAGRRRAFDMPLLLVGTDFQVKVWNELLKIPFGETISYGYLAQRIGMPKAVRAVANANGANPLSVFVPCHRVVGSDRSLTGYGGGIEAKHRISISTSPCAVSLRRPSCLAAALCARCIRPGARLTGTSSSTLPRTG